MKPKKRIMLAAGLTLAALVIPGLYNGLKIQYYTINADAITHPVRIAVVADLHSCKYGENAQELLEATDAQKPDILILAGDFFDDNLDDRNAEAFLRGTAGKYPCYYVTGNHEYWSGSLGFRRKMALLETYGVRRLAGETETISIHGETINLCGVDDPNAYWLAMRDGTDFQSFEEQIEQVREESQNGFYTILVSHRPESFALYVRHGFDLVLCGHAHGGQWRIPGLLNGFYAPGQGFFPKYAGGMYQEGDTTMIVSRGLARESTRVPRFYNRPELVIIDCV